MTALQQEAAELQHSSAAPTVDQLLEENAVLRSRLSLTEAQRVAEDVAREELSRFFKDAVRPSLPPVQDEEEAPEGTGDRLASSSSASFPRGSVSAAITHVSQLAEAAEARAATLQETVVLPLNNRVESLEAEKSELLRRIQTLEMKLEEQPAKPLVKELDLLRLSEELLRSQLSTSQATSEEGVKELVTMLSKSAGASHELVQQTKTITDLKAALRDVLHMNKFLQLEQEEQRRRHALEVELAKSTHEDEDSILRGECEALKKTLADANERASSLEEEKAAVEVACAQLEADMTQLKIDCENRCQAAQEESGEMGDDGPGHSGSGAGHKRRRTELEVLLDDPTSFRGEVLRFYHSGKDTIAALEAQVSDLKAKAEALRIAQGRVVQLERASVVTTAHIADLATEVERLRGESKQQRASAAGLEAERDVIAATLAGAVSGAMSTRELHVACRTIRDAATKAAAASAAIVADPDAIRDATRQAQELKSEVAQLQRQKDQLQRLLQLRQTHVLAQLEKDVLSYSHRSTAGPRARPPLPLDHVLARIQQCAKDIFSANEGSAMGILDSYKAPTNAAESAASVTPFKDSFLACQRHTESLEASSDEAKRQLVVEQTMHQHTREEMERREAVAREALEAKEVALSSAHSANATLTTKLTATTSMLSSLRGQYNQVLNFSEQVLSSTHFVHELLQSEHGYVEGLRDQVRQEREEICELLRATWSTSSGDADGSAQDPRLQASERVADSLERLVTYLTESVADVRGRNEQEMTAFVSRLAGAIRQQEVRVRSLESTFDEATQRQAASLLQRLTEAQQHWDSEWQRKCRALEAERDQWSRGHDAQRALYRRLEHTDLTNNHSAEPDWTHTADHTGASASVAVPPARERAKETLAALENFLAAVRRVPVPAPADAVQAPPPPLAAPVPPPTLHNPDAVVVDPISEATAESATEAVADAAPEQTGTVKDEESLQEASSDATRPVAQEEQEDEEREGVEAETVADPPEADLGVPETATEEPVSDDVVVKKEEQDRLNTTE